MSENKIKASLVMELKRQTALRSCYNYSIEYNCKTKQFESKPLYDYLFGNTVMQCKEALITNDGDIEKSINWLREKYPLVTARTKISEPWNEINVTIEEMERAGFLK